jgi:hypothetical protein
VKSAPPTIAAEGFRPEIEGSSAAICAHEQAKMANGITENQRLYERMLNI